MDSKYISIAFYILLSVYTAGCSHLSASKSPLRSISSTNSDDYYSLAKLKSLNALDTNLETAVPSESTEKAINCVRSICGAEEKNISYTDTLNRQGNTFFYSPEKDTYRKFDVLINELIAESEPEYDWVIQDTQWLAQQTDFKTPVGLSRYTKIGHLVNFVYVELLKNLYQKGEAKYLSDFIWATSENLLESGIHKNEIDWVLKAQDAGFFSPVREYFIYFDIPFEVYVTNTYSNLSFSDAISKIIDQCILNRTKLVESWGFPKEVNIFNYCLRVKEMPKDFPIEMSRLRDEFLVVKLYGDLIDQKFHDLLDEKPMDLAEKAREFLGSQSYKKLQDYAKLDFTSKKAEVKKTCHEKLGGAIEVSGSKLRRRKVNDFIETIRRSTKTLLSFKDPSMNSNFQARIDKAKFTLPRDRLTLIPLIIDDFEAELAWKKEGNKMKKQNQYRGFTFAFNIISYGGLEELDEHGIPSDLYQSVTDICERYSLKPLSDRVYTSTGSAYISWASVQYPKYGMGVMAHEMGHYVSQSLQSMGNVEKLNGKTHSNYFNLPENLSLWESRKCIDSFHSPINASEDENKYTEEDWADFFAGHILNDIKDTYPWTDNFACMLFGEYNSKYHIEFTNSDEDNHSTNFFRLIHLNSLLNSDDKVGVCENFFETKLQCLNH